MRDRSASSSTTRCHLDALLLTATLFGFGVGCGAATPSAAQPDPSADPALPSAPSRASAANALASPSPNTTLASTEPESQSPEALPTECQHTGELCLPPRAFVHRLCLGASTGAAFHLFEKSSPFSRGYVRGREVRAVNTLGGPSSDASLAFGEEVVILTRTGEPKPGGMEVSGMGAYDVLRWDGTCANLADGELALRPPIAPRHAPFDWQDIDANIQEVLLRDDGIRGARKAQRQHCHGVTLGTRSRECIDADGRLNDRIVLAVRTGLALPPPEHIP